MASPFQSTSSTPYVGQILEENRNLSASTRRRPHSVVCVKVEFFFIKKKRKASLLLVEFMADRPGQAGDLRRFHAQS